MSELAAVLIAVAAFVVLALGAAHLALTFIGTKLHPRDPELAEHLRRVSPRITGRTTMWRAWVGFNASHSFGAILFGLIYGYLALAHAPLLLDSPYLLGVGGAMLGGYVVLAKRYWFRAPLTGLLLASAAYGAGVLVSLG